jgi:hypothetical protein
VIGGPPKVFISYRREETAGHAGRIYDAMSGHFGDGNVFMDVDIAPGVDFVKQITDYVGACHVLLVVMGPRWATISNGGPGPRIAQPGDFVRLEVENALRRPDVTVIPVLVGGARMPDAAALPRELEPLSRRNAIELSDSRWRYDVDRLLMTLDALLKDTSVVRPVVPQPRPQPQPQDPAARAAVNPVVVAIGAAVVAALCGALGRAVAQALMPDSPDGKWAKIAVQCGSRALVWALVGAGVAVWIAVRLRRGSPVARFFEGALVGALAGLAGGFVVAGPKYLLDPRPEQSTLDGLAVVGFAVVGLLIGALVGRVWHRRGSAGMAVGAVAGALVGLLVMASGADDATGSGRILVSAMNAAVVVGVVALTQAMLDVRSDQRMRTGVPTGVRL